MKLVTIALIALSLSLGLTGCGIKGPLKPPSAINTQFGQ